YRLPRRSLDIIGPLISVPIIPPILVMGAFAPESFFTCFISIRLPRAQVKQFNLVVSVSLMPEPPASAIISTVSYAIYPSCLCSSSRVVSATAVSNSFAASSTAIFTALTRDSLLIGTSPIVLTHSTLLHRNTSKTCIPVFSFTV
ncbi:hypothetical protein PHMEG_00040626, partial [Phytophthora megakarya]